MQYDHHSGRITLLLCFSQCNDGVNISVVYCLLLYTIVPYCTLMFAYSRLIFAYCIFIDCKCEYFEDSAPGEECRNLLGGVYEI